MSDTGLLLPSSSTPLERDLSASMNPLPRVGPAAELIRTAKREDIPDSVVPFLIYEYGLGELLPYLSDPRTAIATGVLWQRLRGTPQSFRIALGWIGNDGIIEESEGGTSRWSQFQLGLASAPVDLSQTDSVVEIGRLSSPVRSSLFRIYGGWYDGRRFNLDDHQLSGLDTLCDHTGVYLKDEWPQLSFGREFKDEQGDISGDLAGALGIHRQTGISGLYEDRTYLSNSVLGETSWRTLHIEDLSSVISRLHFSLSGPFWKRVTDWDVQLDWGQLLDWAGLQNTFTPALKFAKAGIYLGDGEVLGDTNACLPCTELTEFGDGPFLLSEGDPATGENILSEHLSRVEFVEINERFERGRSTFGPLHPYGFGQGWEPLARLADGEIAWVEVSSIQIIEPTAQIPQGEIRGTVQHRASDQWWRDLFDFVVPLYSENGDRRELRYENQHHEISYPTGIGSYEVAHVLFENPSLTSLKREHKRILAYDDSFELSRSRLSEHTPIPNLYTNTRSHTTEAAFELSQSSQWQVSLQVWDNATWDGDDGWFETAATPDHSWANTFSWAPMPQLEQVLGFSRTMLTLSENGHLSDSDGILGNTHATLGFFEDQRIERAHQTTAEHAGSDHQLGLADNWVSVLGTLGWNSTGTIRDVGYAVETIQIDELAGTISAQRVEYHTNFLFTNNWHYKLGAVDTFSLYDANGAQQRFQYRTTAPVNFNWDAHNSGIAGVWGGLYALDLFIGNPLRLVPTHREHFKTLAYDDLFELSRTRLSEHIPLFNEQAITRDHGSAATWHTEQFDTWADTSPAWSEPGNDWSFPGWFDGANEPTWGEAYTWQQFPQLERVSNHYTTHLYLSDTDDGLGGTNATLGYNLSQRFDRLHFAQATENRQSFTTRQHTRSVFVAISRFEEPTWQAGDWAGPGATDWVDTSSDWAAGSWGSVEWFDPSTITWANQTMWGKIARWQIASLVVESVHETHN